MKNNTKKITIISIVLFALIFGALLVTATFTDLQVSQLLTKGTLPAGSYLATGLFGVVLECLGCTAPYIVGALSLELIFVYTLRFMNNKKLRALLLVLLQIATFAAYYAVAIDTLGYNIRHYHLEGTPAFMKAEIAFIALLLTFLSVLAVNNLSDESIKRAPWVAFAVAFAIALSSITVTLIKEPFGRPRFRAMNYANDFSYYSRWYVLNGQPDKEWMRSYFSTSDACKSFPSGHTQSASMIFCIIMLKELMGIKSKGKTAALWIASIVWTGAVALSRIMVGAHFFSDVLVGGTIGFIFVIAGREIFVDKFEHIKSLKGKAK